MLFPLEASPSLPVQSTPEASPAFKVTSHLFFPFDLGLELDFAGKGARDLFKEISSRKMTQLGFENHLYPEADISTQIYKFGVGLLHLSARMELTLQEAARMSCQAEQLHVGKRPILTYCQGLVEGVIQHASPYASYRYEKRFAEADLFPVFVMDQAPGEEAEAFIRQNEKALYGIVAGEPRYEALSAFSLQRGKLENYGYYENEMVLIQRFGAVVHSAEAETILELIKLAYAQYWSLKAYSFILDRELDDAQDLLKHLPPYYKFWRIPHQYQRFSTEALDFSRDKLAIVESLYSVSGSVPHIEADWHLNTLYSSIRKVFSVEDLYKAVDVKLGRIEEAYNSTREFLSTNFFILLDIVFFATLIWSIIDTVLLWNIAHHGGLP